MNNRKKLFIKTGGNFNLAEREAKIIRKLTHEVEIISDFLPNILFYSIERDFIIMDYIEGNMLDECINSNLLSDEDKKLIINQMYLLLCSLNKANIIHRDIRPENFIVTRGSNNNVKIILIDFAFALLLKTDEFYEILLSPKNIKLLSKLGDNLNPKSLTWDDAYSFLMTLKRIDVSFKKKHPEMWKNINNMINKFAYTIPISTGSK